MVDVGDAEAGDLFSPLMHKTDGHAGHMETRHGLLHHRAQLCKGKVVAGIFRHSTSHSSPLSNVRGV